ncbi:MAG: septation protein SepH [bacterium]
MVERLGLVGLSGDGTALDLADSAGTPYTLAIDDRLAQAVAAGPGRSPARTQREERALDSLTPRDIQALVRAGADPRELAEEYSLPVERSERFAGPPLAERAWVSEQARAVTVRGDARGAEGATLDATVLDAALAAGASVDDITWDAWRGDDGRWTVLASYPGPDGSVEESRWSFDPRTRSLHPHGMPLAVVPDGPPEPAPQQRSLAQAAASLEDAAVAAEASDAEVEQASDPGGRGRRGRRASVPSWDEILFGAGQPES